MQKIEIPYEQRREPMPSELIWLYATVEPMLMRDKQIVNPAVKMIAA